MPRRKWLVVILVFSLLAFTIFLIQHDGSSNWFVEYSLPLKETYKLMDVGIVDANGDKLLDI